jgi:two-component system CheB/CheR fusion protein
VYGAARDLLQIGEGQMSLDVLKLLPRELSWAAGLLLQAVSADGRPESAAPVTLGEGAAARRVRLVARRLPEKGPIGDTGGAPCTLLSFEPLDLPTPSLAHTAELDEEQRRRVEVLERELDLTHESLQATIEELETANEELQASNEELMASNEELQSTNEELQSVNEELYTVNSEYQEKVDVLNSVNADLENVAKATATPTLFVDEQLRLLRFTPELMQLVKVREGDRGRSLEDFANTLDYPELFSDLRRTLKDRVVTEREVRSRDGQWWLARMQPYAARAPGSTKAVMSFVNVTSLKDSQRLQSVIDSLAEHLAVLDSQGAIIMVNQAWRRFAIDNGDAELRHSGPGSNYLRVCASAALEDPDARLAHDGVSAVLAGRQPQFTLQYPCDSGGRRLWFLMHAAPVAHPAGGAVVSHIDITAWAQSAAGTNKPPGGGGG